MSYGTQEPTHEQREALTHAGAITGGVIGTAVGGPAGAALGAATGGVVGDWLAVALAGFGLLGGGAAAKRHADAKAAEARRQGERQGWDEAKKEES